MIAGAGSISADNIARNVMYKQECRRKAEEMDLEGLRKSVTDYDASLKGRITNAFGFLGKLETPIYILEQRKVLYRRTRELSDYTESI